ncbi:MAG: phytoene desaturase [Pleurocapsa minor GSE-CHR-MK-17-07R]|nr:phytoene desaturase [Pleurocapsa minor GSE-CHR-MK 17-07R]
MTRRVIVAGGGIGGLSAAIHLAAAGWQVTVLEQNSAVGGKMGEIRAGDFRWDTGPSVITMRQAFEDLFAVAGRDLRDYLTLLPVDPLTRYFYPDGTLLDASRLPTIMAARIREFSGQADADGYLRYLKYAQRIHDITGPVFIYNDPPSLLKLARTRLWDIPAVDPLRSMQSAIRGFVKSPKMRQLLGRFATYVGASPYLAPATLNVIAHVELSGGVWYPQGGIFEIARAFEKLARELGVEIRTGVRVDEICVEAGRVTGVRSGVDMLPADAVVADIDVATVYEKLLPRGSYPAAQLNQLVRTEPSCSGFILLLGVNRKHAELAHHNIVFSSDYAREFDDIFRRGVPPDDPTIYISITSKTDASHAPDGSENWFVLVNAPPLGESFDWAAGAGEYRDRVLAALARRGLDVREHIVSEQMLTPVDIERLTGARRGALYGTSSNDRFNALRRPHNRSPHVRGLYFAGGTTHPGGGVPMVTLSGKVAARMAQQDAGCLL